MKSIYGKEGVGLMGGGGGYVSIVLQKIRHVPSWCEKASDFLLLCLVAAAAAGESRLYDSMIHWQPNENRTALSSLCGIKAASISAAVREGELGIGWQYTDNSAPNIN